MTSKEKRRSVEGMPKISSAMPTSPTEPKKDKKESKKDSRGPKVDKKNLSKAERRAAAQKEQELARSRKQKSGTPSLDRQKTETLGAMEVRERKLPKQNVVKSIPAVIAAAIGVDELNINRVPYFLHLPDFNLSAPLSDSMLHPEIVRLGVKYANGIIRGSSARCVGLITAFKAVVADFKLPQKIEFSKAFYDYLRPMIRYIIECRPLSVSMGNMIRSFKSKISSCRGMMEIEALKLLDEYLDEFLDERLLTAQQLICDFGTKKIVDGDVIVTYACSFVVSKVLIEAKNAGKNFRLICVDSNPLMEGKEFIKRMTEAGIDCTYVLLNGACYVMKEATKVFLGAYALLSNGNLVSRVGTALVAMAAHEYKVPVIVCAETIKFSEKTMLDSITWNELGNANDLAENRFNDTEENLLANWKDTKGLTLLSIYYDVTPTEYITMIVTEFGMIPPTSVPVIIREYGNPDEELET